MAFVLGKKNKFSNQSEKEEAKLQLLTSGMRLYIEKFEDSSKICYS